MHRLTPQVNQDDSGKLILIERHDYLKRKWLDLRNLAEYYTQLALGLEQRLLTTARQLAQLDR